MLKSHLLGEIMWYDKAHELQHVSATRIFIRFLVKHNNFGLILIEKRSQVRARDLSLRLRPLLEPGPRWRVVHSIVFPLWRISYDLTQKIIHRPQ